jgi:hypothetical protein
VTTAELERHFVYLEAEWASAQAAPLSRRKAMLVVMLVDAYVDRLFGADPAAEDILEFRAGLAAKSADVGLVMAVAADHPDGPRLVTEAVEVPLADYGRLGIEDQMVSLYNDRTVQRVRIALPDGTRLLAHEVIGEAIEALRRI